MPSDDYSMMGGMGEEGDAVYTAMAALSSVFLLAALILVLWELKSDYGVLLFLFNG